ncbi:hypothetical protein BKA65DRAFT_404464 [Rhexocercosporidium sp. MPI-PUGE-AT-0058]|nr:hypothetical protein BKA65DRAFT_404464 [Rhexocercosporidium sp. MPI-PUGE-AT-0058]
MKFSTILPVALVSFAMAAPVAEPQDIDFEAYEAIEVVPDVTAPIGVATLPVASYDQEGAIDEAVASAIDPVDPDLTKRGSCLPQPAGNGPVTVPDTDTAFLANPVYSAAALGAPVPSGWFLVDGYKNLHASAAHPSYQTYVSSSLTTYDPAKCATICAAKAGCNSFNIFFERDPTIFTDKVNCPTSASLTRIKCSFFGSVISAADATNDGQFTGQFHVVTAGSNAYTTTPQSVDGFTGPVSLGSATINAPIADHSFMGSQTFPMTQPYDPAVCAAACQEKSAYNRRHESTPGSARICRFFDAYLLYKNGQNPVFTCAYYTKAYGPEFATNVGQYNPAHDHFTNEHSYTYTLEE